VVCYSESIGKPLEQLLDENTGAFDEEEDAGELVQLYRHLPLRHG